MDTEQAQHTPGPWELREVGHSPGNIYRVEVIAPQYLYGKRTHSRLIAQIVDYRDWTDQPANARLIASAPSLLEALEEIAEGDGCNCRVGPGCDWKCKDIARRAIDKSSGKRTECCGAKGEITSGDYDDTAFACDDCPDKENR